MIIKPPVIEEIEAFIFDFDGVLTNNKVHIDQNGKELVSCSRADGLAFDALRKLKKPTYILSSEKNSVVEARAKKLKVLSIQGVSDKVKSINQLVMSEGLNINNIFYVGNDLNDYYAMKLCGYSACPSNSHEKIKLISNFHLNSKGGDGVVRELLEEIIGIDLIEILYN